MKMTFSSLALVSALIPTFLTAYAPLQPKGTADVTPTVSYFDTEHFFNKNGKKLYSYNDFQRTRLDILVEAGITDTDALSYWTSYDQVHDHLNGDEYEFPDAELGWKRLLAEWDDAVFSAELLAIIPYEKKYIPDIRYGKWGGEFALLYAQTYNVCDYKITLDGRLGYRWYSGFPSDQIRSDLSAWIDVSCHWQFLAQSSVEYGLFNGDEPPNYSFFFYNANYRVWKGRVEAIYYVNERFAITAGYMRHFMGENIATGGEVYGRVTYCF